LGLIRQIKLEKLERNQKLGKVEAETCSKRRSQLINPIVYGSKILILGLDSSGKTTLLFALKLKEIVTTVPTQGFNSEEIDYNHRKFTMIDLGGDSINRLQWSQYYEWADGIIFAVDATDEKRIIEAKQSLDTVLDNTGVKPVLILATKFDLPNTMSVSEVSVSLDLQHIRGREWFIQAISACTGDGLYEGLDWLKKVCPKSNLGNLPINTEPTSNLLSSKPTLPKINISLTSLFNKKKEKRILMIGLDASGKTTILYKMKLGEVVTTIPTFGFNVETIEYLNFSLTIWDVGGQPQTRNLWRHYYQGTNVIIFVVDSNDSERMEDARVELKKCFLEDELDGVPLLVFTNKQDLPNAMSISEITSSLALNELTGRKFYIQPCCATTGDGLYEGLDWIKSILS